MTMVEMIHICFGRSYSELSDIILKKYGNMEGGFKELGYICYTEQIKWLREMKGNNE